VIIFSGQEASEDFDFEELDSDFDDNYDSEYDINEDSTENENFDSLYIRSNYLFERRLPSSVKYRSDD